MCVYLCAKFEVSSINLTSFRQGSFTPFKFCKVRTNNYQVSLSVFKIQQFLLFIQIPKVKIPLKLTLISLTLNGSNIWPKYFSPKMAFPLNPNLGGLFRVSF